MNTWIFQGNPKVFNIDGYVTNRRQIWWSLRQTHYEKKVQLGDEVYLWRSDGGRKGSGGILAKTIVIGLPTIRTNEDAREYWYTDDWKTLSLAVCLEIEEVRLHEGFLKRVELNNNSVLKDMLIFRFSQQTNYLLEEIHAQELRHLWNEYGVNKVDAGILAKDIEAEEVENNESMAEGKVISYYGKRYERDLNNRKRAIEIHGYSCVVCGFNFEAQYGDRGRDFIEVHHVKPLFELDGEKEIDPRTDLVPVCANCHRMIHRRYDNVLSIDQLKVIVKKER